jgi:hypothetical protein
MEKIAMTDLPDLIARVESAPPEQERALLEEGFALLHPAPDPQFHPAFHTWDVCRTKFFRKLDANAGLCAAMMLVPCDYPKWAVTGRNSATLGTKGGAPGALEWTFASTPALALLAARLKQEMQDG